MLLTHPHMSYKSQDIVGKVQYWYLLYYGTYIIFYEATKSLHLLPKFLLDKLVLQDISYQTLVHGVGANKLI
jgi:hypothetical protein